MYKKIVVSSLFAMVVVIEMILMSLFQIIQKFKQIF
jgi:hypothetical protein